MTNNFVVLDHVHATGEDGHNDILWYVDCLLQMLLFVALVTAANFRWQVFDSPMRFVLALLAAGAALRFILPWLLDPNYLSVGITATGPFAHLPTTHLGTLVLGMCMAQVQSWRARASMALVVVAWVVGLGLTSASESHSWVMLLVFGLLLLYVPRLPIPKGLHLVVLMLSGASLFIYLTHIQIAGQIFQRMGVPEGSLLIYVLTLASGVLLWMGWQRLADVRLRVGQYVVQSIEGLRPRSIREEIASRRKHQRGGGS
jgi:hypothetical protein